MPVLFGKYEYDPQKDKLGEGSFGSVYHCHDILLNRDYAIKISKPISTESDRYGLISEFSRVIDFQHENIVRYFNVFRLEGINGLDEKTVRQVGVMELVEGTNLQKEIEKGITDENHIREIALGVLSGLQYLHKNGLIHRDLKPSNILLSIKDGKIIPKIGDFGISKMIETSTSAGLSGIIGTMAYMAPEQFGTQDSRIGFSGDIWAFGIILYEMFTGKTPFGNEKTHTQGEIMNKILHDALPSLIETIQEPFRSVILKCLQKDSSIRYQNAPEIITEISTRGTCKPQKSEEFKENLYQDTTKLLEIKDSFIENRKGPEDNYYLEKDRNKSISKNVSIHDESERTRTTKPISDGFSQDDYYSGPPILKLEEKSKERRKKTKSSLIIWLILLALTALLFVKAFIENS